MLALLDGLVRRTLVPFVEPTSTNTIWSFFSSILACVVETSLSLGRLMPFSRNFLPPVTSDEAGRRADRHLEGDALVRARRRHHGHRARWPAIGFAAGHSCRSASLALQTAS